MGAAMQTNQVKTVTQFCNDNTAFTQAAMRGLIFKAEPRITHEGTKPGNGLIEAGAIIRIGRRVLIDEAKFFAWVRQQQPVSQAA
jgi:hypothetical protein